MADQLTIARPYGRAAFEFASNSGVLDAWSDWLVVSSALIGHQKVDAFINNPTLSASKRAEQFCALLAGSDEQTAASASQSAFNSFRNFIALLALNNRLTALSAVYSVFERLKYEREHVQPVEILSPYELDKDQIAKISTSIKRRLNKEVSVTVQIDPGLIGGIVVRAGDVVIDGSLSGRLAKLQNTLKS